MRRVLKRTCYAVSILAITPIWLLYRLESLFIGAEKSFQGFSQFVSLFPGMPGNYLRWAFYRLTIAELGEDTCIGFGTTLAHPSVRIGRGVYVGPFCNLGLCTIRDDVLLGTGVHIMSGLSQHNYSDLSVPIRDQKGSLRNVCIGQDTWIGNAAVIGNDVGTKCVIGAASLVIHEIPPYSIAAGNPAKIIRDRREQVLSNEE